MSPAQLISSLIKKGVQVSYKGDALVYWPSQLVTGRDREEIKERKAHLIHYLRGVYQLKRGDPVTNASGNKNVWEIYPESNRLGLIDNEGAKEFCSYDEIASHSQFQFLKSRISLIETYVYAQPVAKRAEAFACFKHEWNFLFKELNRQQFLIETYCGPIGGSKTNQGKEIQNVMAAM
ncbi:MAG TPA: hypothetical protein VIG33_07660 [Pseudobdellovibrionaceae bacterium]|jgi:hypothetical protein